MTSDHHQARPTNYVLDYTSHALGSVLASAGKTQVIVTFSHLEEVPSWLRPNKSEQGWVTAEYNLLPSSTQQRHKRERSRISGRTSEIQRILSRSLRAAVDLTQIPGQTLIFDCDVILADGGTRTTSLNGAMVALILAISRLQKRGKCASNTLKDLIGAISIATHDKGLIVDPDYNHDYSANADITVVMNSKQQLVEIQGCAEKQAFSPTTLQEIVALAGVSLAPTFDYLERLKDEYLA